jgi:predicted RNA-binding protein YlxR (DUF448 family)
VNAENIKYMFMSLDQNAGRSQYVHIDDSCFIMADDLRYLEKPEQDKILFREKLRMNDSGNVCSHSVRNLLSSSFIFKINLYVTLKFLLCCMGVKCSR